MVVAGAGARGDQVATGGGPRGVVAQVQGVTAAVAAVTLVLARAAGEVSVVGGVLAGRVAPEAKASPILNFMQIWGCEYVSDRNLE